MSYAAVRSAITERLAAVPDVDNVTDHEIWTLETLDDSDWQELFKDTAGYLQCWFLGQKSWADKQGVSDGWTRIRRDIVLTGIHSAQESTGTYNFWQDIIDSVRQAFNASNADRSLGGACLSHSLVQHTGTVGTKFQGTILSYITVLTLTVEEIDTNGEILTQMTGNASTTAAMALPVNPNRKGFRLVNQDPNAVIYWGDSGVQSGLTAQVDGGSPVAPNFGEVVISGYTGAVYIICDAGTPPYSITDWS